MQHRPTPTPIRMSTLNKFFTDHYREDGTYNKLHMKKCCLTYDRLCLDRRSQNLSGRCCSLFSQPRSQQTVERQLVTTWCMQEGSDWREGLDRRNRAWGLSIVQRAEESTICQPSRRYHQQHNCSHIVPFLQHCLSWFEYRRLFWNICNRLQMSSLFDKNTNSTSQRHARDRFSTHKSKMNGTRETKCKLRCNTVWSIVLSYSIHKLIR